MARQTLGANVATFAEREDADVPTVPIARQAAPAVGSKEKVSVRLPATLCDSMRDAVAQLGTTLDQLVAAGIRSHLELLKREHTGGAL